jgi:hypothetical protein
MDLFPDPLLLRESDSAGNRTRTSGSVARNSDHKTTEVVNIIYIYISNKQAQNEDFPNIEGIKMKFTFSY